MASELESLRLEVKRMSQQLEASLQSSQSVFDADINVDTSKEELQTPVQQVYILGGHDGNSWLRTVNVLCPSRSEYFPVASLQTPRSYAAASVLMGQIYVFGGGNGKLWYETGNFFSFQVWNPDIFQNTKYMLNNFTCS
jgi:kelch-like protein 20